LLVKVKARAPEVIMLALEVEFLTGVSVAARPNRREEAEWPPHPDRLFQALLAAWGRNEPPLEDERRALEWLEALDMETLQVSAPLAHARQVGAVYVPPNDARTTGKVGNKAPKGLRAAAQVVPELRTNRQPRAFPAMLPAAEPPVVRYVWSQAKGLDQYRDALERLVSEVTYLGHSHSLVRVALMKADQQGLSADQSWVDERGAALRVPYKGRLSDLVNRYRRSEENGRAIRPTPSLVTRDFQPPSIALPEPALFDADNVTVLADVGGFVPDLVAFPLVAKRMRDTFLKTASDNGLPIPTLLSGHDTEGRATREPHVAIVPLADVGWDYSQGRLMGLALVWPREITDADRRIALKVIVAFLSGGDRTFGLLHFGSQGSWSLALEPESTRASLRFARYVRASRRWCTVLPAALDRHPKDKPGDELASIITNACVNIGLPKTAVDGLNIEIYKHASVRGAPSAVDVRTALPQDSSYRGKPLVHLVLNFPAPVQGPLILGAGRFRGLGLCLPLEEERR
jgi:CRISPR-associated protein Csb2